MAETIRWVLWLPFRERLWPDSLSRPAEVHRGALLLFPSRQAVLAPPEPSVQKPVRQACWDPLLHMHVGQANSVHGYPNPLTQLARASTRRMRLQLESTNIIMHHLVPTCLPCYTHSGCIAHNKSYRRLHLPQRLVVG